MSDEDTIKLHKILTDEDRKMSKILLFTDVLLLHIILDRIAEQ